jgi:hypothetical protein
MSYEAINVLMKRTYEFKTIKQWLNEVMDDRPYIEVSDITDDEICEVARRLT